MSLADGLFDGALGVLLLVLAIAVLHGRNLYTSIVLFIAFGLVLAVTWAHLGAPDLALAEAAIGAGLTGALLLAAFAQQDPELSSSPSSSPGLSRSWLPHLPAALLALLIFTLLVRSMWPLAEGPVILPELVQAQLSASGVEHPVTAVLLNFRAWDTLLELLVLLLALLGVRQLRPTLNRIPPPWPLLVAWSKVLAPLTVLIGGYLLWRGAYAPGGAFQAGALLAAGAVILRLNHILPPLSWQDWQLRVLALMGLVTFLLVGGLSAWFGKGWLHYPEAYSGTLIFIIEVAATLSIAVTLTLLVVGEEEELTREH